MKNKTKILVVLLVVIGASVSSTTVLANSSGAKENRNEIQILISTGTTTKEKAVAKRKIRSNVNSFVRKDLTKEERQKYKLLLEHSAISLEYLLSDQMTNTQRAEELVKDRTLFLDRMILNGFVISGLEDEFRDYVVEKTNLLVDEILQGKF